MACFGLGHLSIAFIGLGLCAALLTPSIEFVFWITQGFRNGLWELARLPGPLCAAFSRRDCVLGFCDDVNEPHFPR